jgi:AcrR family transcriptional regulator
MAMDNAEERWRDIRRTRLLDAADRIFARLGYDGASMEDIAFEAGVGKPTLYRYFPSKAELFEAVFSHTLDELERRLDLAVAEGGAFSLRLRRVVEELVPTFRKHIVSMRDLSEGDEASKRRIFRKRRGGIEARLVALLREAVEAGEIRPVDPAVIARFMIGLVWTGTNSHLEGEARIVDAVVDFALHGLGAGEPASGKNASNKNASGEDVSGENSNASGGDA